MATFKTALTWALLVLLQIHSVLAGYYKQPYVAAPVYNAPAPPTKPTTVAKPQVVAAATSTLPPIRVPCPPYRPKTTQVPRPTNTETIITQPIVTQTIITQPASTVTVTQSPSATQGTITITLVDANNNPLSNLLVNVYDQYGNIVWTGTTNSLGQVTITLPPGNYILVPEWPSGLRPASPNDRFEIVIYSGQNPTITHSFIVQPNGPGIITINVKDASGKPISGIEVEILGGAGNQLQSVKTSNDGMAQVNLAPGDYIVKPILPNNLGAALAHNLHVVANERQFITFIIPNTPVSPQVTTGTIAGNVYNDINHSGTVDSGEGLDKIPVTITANNGRRQQVLTDANGYYKFTLVPAGSYKIEVGDIPGVDVSLDARTRDVELAPGATVIFNVQLVNVPSTTLPIPIIPTDRPGTITIRVFSDTNWNSTLDPSEKLIPDVPIALLNNNQNFIATERTSSTGMVTFQNVPPGTYTVMADVRGIDGVGVTSVEGLVQINSGERFTVDFAIQVYNDRIQAV